MPGNTFENRRDTAIVRLLVDTGMRAGELCGLGVVDLDFDHQVAHVLGKAGRNRACPFGAKSADALRRYLRFRTRHTSAGLSCLWLGKKGRLSDSGVRQMLERRCLDAGSRRCTRTSSGTPSPTIGSPPEGRSTT
jgi:site-specific recombinase XerD